MNSQTEGRRPRRAGILDGVQRNELRSDKDWGLREQLLVGMQLRVSRCRALHVDHSVGGVEVFAEIDEILDSWRKFLVILDLRSRTLTGNCFQTVHCFLLDEQVEARELDCWRN